MSKSLLRVLSVLALLAVVWVPLLAQTAPTPEELVLRPGDKITWTPVKGHEVRFGGRADVTKFDDVTKALQLDPALKANAQGIARAGVNKQLKATVLPNAAVGSTLNFTCGLHPSDMVTVPFTIAAPVAGQAPREVQITTPQDGSFTWNLETAKGPKQLAPKLKQ